MKYIPAKPVIVRPASIIMIMAAMISMIVITSMKVGKQVFEAALDLIQQQYTCYYVKKNIIALVNKNWTLDFSNPVQ